MVAAAKKIQMQLLKSTWTTITGSISSIIPLFFTVCKTGACTAACVSPMASVLGISSASLASSPLMESFIPLLLAISAVSFTVSYYKLYVLPKYAIATTNSSCSTDCACDAPKKSKQHTFALWSFWVGLVASVAFFTYFEFQAYQSKIAALNVENTEILSDENADVPCCAAGKTCDATETETESIE